MGLRGSGGGGCLALTVDVPGNGTVLPHRLCSIPAVVRKGYVCRGLWSLDSRPFSDGDVVFTRMRALGRVKNYRRRDLAVSGLVDAPRLSRCSFCSASNLHTQPMKSVSFSCIPYPSLESQ